MKSASSVESLFMMLKAENEPWLGEVFVSLPVFERLRSNQSIILYGEPGSGKTAMRLEAKRQEGDSKFQSLWVPEPIVEESASGTALAQQAMRQALQACVENLVLEGGLPGRLNEPSSHIASALQWFLQNYLPFDPLFYLPSQSDRLKQEEVQWYLKIMERPPSPVIREGSSIKDEIRLLRAVLHQAKYEQLWLVIDGLERWAPLQVGEQVKNLLDAILSTLVIFDVSGVIFKFFLPASWKRSLHETTGVERFRAEETQLLWNPDNLQIMLEKRLAYMLSAKKASLDSLCDGEYFLSWLREFGGNSPRSWLMFSAPLVAEYQKQGRWLNLGQTREFIRNHPPSLRLQHDRREVWLGQKCIPIGSEPEFRLLEYLSRRPGMISSLKDVYYFAQEKLEAIPDNGANEWVPKETLRKRLETMVWRIRQRIEPDPKNPTYLVTHHGKGLEILHLEL